MRVLARLFNPIVKYSEILWNINPLLLKTRALSLTHLTHCSNQQWGSKKSHRNIKLNLLKLQNMADPKIEVILAPMRALVKEQVSWKLINF